MQKEDLFIRNIHSRNQDRISVALIYDTLSKEAHSGCGLYYEIYPRAGFCGGLAPHTVAARLYFPPRRGICRLGATNPFKAAFPFFRACEEKIG
ncbi:hypothetical protein [Klebsiella pneumoniae]|uniref:hypothetical protein n=1 Tax=Klebsiella pneumoniae TaxID=573 RepID=UPI003D35CBC0